MQYSLDLVVLIGLRPGKIGQVENLDTAHDQESGQDYINTDWGRGGEHVCLGRNGAIPARGSWDGG